MVRRTYPHVHHPQCPPSLQIPLVTLHHPAPPPPAPPFPTLSYHPHSNTTPYSCHSPLSPVHLHHSPLATIIPSISHFTSIQSPPLIFLLSSSFNPSPCPNPLSPTPNLPPSPRPSSPCHNSSSLHHPHARPLSVSPITAPPPNTTFQAPPGPHNPQPIPVP